jgi:hypothetical protein
MNEMSNDLNIRLDKDEHILNFERNILDQHEFDGSAENSKMKSSNKKAYGDHSRKHSFIPEDPLEFFNGINQIKND